MKILQTSIKDIKPNPSNPRLIKDDKFKKLVQSIKDFPEMLEMRPIVVNDDNIVLGGNMRLKACHEAGLKVIPVIKASELSEEKQREFIIKDNVGFGEWDWQMLQNDWDTDKLDDWGLDIPSEFTVAPEASEDDYEIPDEVKTDIVLGDLFQIGEHRLLCGDSTDSDQVANLMNGEKADMVFTDPPYNVAYQGGSKKREKIENDEIKDFYQFLYDAFMNCLLNTKSGASVYIAHSDLERANFTKAFIDAGFKLSSVIVWVKDNSSFSMSKDYKWKHEPIIYGWNANGAHTFYGDTRQDTVWNIKRPSRSDEHPTMKPIELVAKALNNSSKSEDLIFEPFTGSGSTMVAAHQLKRKCYGMELDPKYCQVIIDRMLKLDPNLKIKRNGQDYKTEIKQ
jgi:DNA modification methylase